MRLQAALAQLQRDGKNGLVALSNGHNSFLESNAIFVLAGFRAIGESALVVDTEGSATLIVTPAWDAQRAREK